MRAIYKCRRRECGETWTHDYSLKVRDELDTDRNYYRILNDVKVYPGDKPDALCPVCNKYSPYKRVVGEYSSEHLCDARCRNARGSYCKCSCGGANHGLAYSRSAISTSATAQGVLSFVPGDNTRPDAPIFVRSGRVTPQEVDAARRAAAPLDDLFDAARHAGQPVDTGLWDD